MLALERERADLSPGPDDQIMRLVKPLKREGRINARRMILYAETTDEAGNKAAGRAVVQPGELVMDFRTATPAMAAAVALASRPFTSKVVQLREPEGSSSKAKTVIVAGEPKVWEESNPWNEEAQQARQEACILFNQGTFSSAAKKFRQIEKLVSGGLKPLYHSLCDVAEGYALWEAFHYREAWDKLKTSLKALELA